MTCQESQNSLPGHLVDALPDEEAARVAHHLSGCQSCREELDNLRASMELLRGWEEDVPSGLANRTIARLAAEPVTLSWWRRLALAVDQRLAAFGAHRPTRVTGLATVMVALILLYPVVSPNWERGRSSGAVTGCRSNLRLLGKALDRYAKDHDNRFPAKMSDLTPKYVRMFPECPHAGTNTYDSGYMPSADRRHYTLACHGNHHHDDGLGSDEPRLRR